MARPTRKGMMSGGRHNYERLAPKHILNAPDEYWFEGSYYDSQARPPKMPPATRDALAAVVGELEPDKRLTASLRYRTDTKRFYLSVYNSANSQWPRLCLAFRDGHIVMFTDDSLEHDDEREANHLATFTAVGPDFAKVVHEGLLEQTRKWLREQAEGHRKAAAKHDEQLTAFAGLVPPAVMPKGLYEV